MSSTSNVSRHVEGFEETVKDFWESRPRRPRKGRKLAGVAVAVGNRYGIDATLVRVGLVALTAFGGIGLSLYLLGWLLFPEEGDNVSGLESLLGKGDSALSRGFTVALCLLLVPITGWIFSDAWMFNGGGFLGLAMAVTALYLLHRSHGHLNRPPRSPVLTQPGDTGDGTPFPPVQTTSATSDGTTTPATSAPLVIPADSATPADSGILSGSDNAAPPSAAATPAHPGAAEPGRTGSPGWDPLGAAPLDWHLSGGHEPPANTPPSAPPEPGPCRRKSRIGLATFGLALLAGGIGGALAAGGEPWFTPAHVAGMVLGVIGLGMVLGSFLGGGRGLVWLAVPLSVAGLVSSTVPVGSFHGGMGEIHAAPTTAQQVRGIYERTAGGITLDLTGLITDSPVDTTVRSGAGSVTVRVSENADVTYHCESSIGNAACFGRENSGVGTPALTGTDLGSDGPGGQRITLRATSAAGIVEVYRVP